MHFASQEQRLSLFLSFRSVNFEWSDLDGMRSVLWRYSVRQRLGHFLHCQLFFHPISFG
jgi:hypothetical protein